MKKTFTCEEITKIAEARIDQAIKLSKLRRDLRSEYFSKAMETLSFWSELAYAKEDHERLLSKVINIIEEWRKS